jgi:copper chaperone CopZ
MHAVEDLKYKVTACLPGQGSAASPAVGSTPASEGIDPAKFILASKPLENGHVQASIGIAGMCCADCQAKLDAALGAVKGVDSCKASMADGQAVVTFDPAQVGVEALIASVRSAGFEPAAGPAGKAAEAGGCKCGAGGHCADGHDGESKDEKAGDHHGKESKPGAGSSV